MVLEGVYNLELFVTQKCVENTICTSLPAYNHTYFKYRLLTIMITTMQLRNRRTACYTKGAALQTIS